jgi:hypothetical protein
MNHDSCLQVEAYQPQDSLIRYPLGDPSHEDVMIDPIEAFLQVDIHNPLISLLYVLLCLSHCLVGISTGSKTITVI